MHKTLSVDIQKDILASNRELADENQAILKERGVRAYDFLGAIGSGKTLLIERILDGLEDSPLRAAAVAGDVAGDDDYNRFIKHGIPAQNISTGKECHLDAHLVRHAIDRLPLDEIDIIFIENVGNLVCPVDFPLGAEKRVVVISITEGDDMVRKHPSIFAFSDIVVINKIDMAEAMEINPDSLADDAKMVNPNAEIVQTDARHGAGIERLMAAMGISEHAIR